jgi:hypothetical protein
MQIDTTRSPAWRAISGRDAAQTLQSSANFLEPCQPTVPLFGFDNRDPKRDGDGTETRIFPFAVTEQGRQSWSLVLRRSYEKW